MPLTEVTLLLVLRTATKKRSISAFPSEQVKIKSHTDPHLPPTNPKPALVSVPLRPSTSGCTQGMWPDEGASWALVHSKGHSPKGVSRWHKASRWFRHLCQDEGRMPQLNACCEKPKILFRGLLAHIIRDKCYCTKNWTRSLSLDIVHFLVFRSVSTGLI